MGAIVEEHRRPFLWIPGQLPFFVTDPSRLSIQCATKFRLYADRLDSNVPIFKDTLTIGPSSTQKAAANIPCFPAPEDVAPALPNAQEVALAPPDDLDVEISVPEVPLEDGEAAGQDVRVRRMSKRALVEEANLLNTSRHTSHTTRTALLAVSHTCASEDSLGRPVLKTINCHIFD